MRTRPWRPLACLWALLLFTVAAPAAPAGPFLHGLFSSDMVLQRDVPCPVWGWCAPGTAVTVTLDAEPAVAATAAADGRWQATLPAHAAGGPHTLTVAGPQNVVLKNVLFGDIWLCSGQSNMDFGIDGVDQWWNELPGAPVDGIRLYWITPTSSFAPATNVTGTWSVASRDTLQRKKQPFTTTGFSAIAWLFARTVQQKTGVPIGVIECAQGNTAIQSWSTIASLRQLPLYGPTLDPLDYYQRELRDWAKAADPADAGTAAWRTPEFDDHEWPTMDLPKDWTTSPVGTFSGLMWFRRTVELPADWVGQDLQLHLGPIEDQETTWVNGNCVGGEDGYRRDHTFTVPAALLHAGANLITVRVLGNRGFVGQPVQLVLTKGAATAATDRLALTGPWRYHPSTPGAELKGRKRQYDRIWVPGGLYHGMVAPLAPFALKGFLWYQGEGNAGQATYDQQLTAMIGDWRTLFGQGELPFYLVQLAGFGPLPAAPQNSSWAFTRELQAKVARTVPHCGLTVAIDRGEITNIHPPNKRPVAERLAAVALAKSYGLDVPCEGPTYRAMTVAGNQVTLSFDHAAGLQSLGAGPTGFAIAGADKQFVWATATLVGETVVVSAPSVATPVAVRYGWGDNALCNLYNRDNLPAVPFRTDAW